MRTASLKILLLFLVLSILLASCGNPPDTFGFIRNSERKGTTPQSGFIEGLFSISSDGSDPRASELASAASEKYARNTDTVGWLRLPDTSINDVVLCKKGDNDYYLRRNFEKRYSFNGVYFADGGCDFGDGGRRSLPQNTVIYGHSMSDSKSDVMFGPMRNYLEEDFARENPYIYFSTVSSDFIWEVFAVSYTDVSVPYTGNSLDSSSFNDMLAKIREQSLFEYGYEYSPEDKFLTLSTCVYSLPAKGKISYPNDYRFVIMARLVPENEELVEYADIKLNHYISPP